MTLNEKQLARDQFAKSGVLDKRVDELVALCLPHIKSPEEAIRNLHDDFSSNLSVLPENIQVFRPPIEITPSLIDGRDPRWLNRYSAPISLSRAPTIPNRSAPPRAAGKGTDPNLLSQDAYVRFTAAQMKVIERMHNLLSSRFAHWLRAVGATNVRAETNKVDLVCTLQGAECLFELKTTSGQSTRLALRDAVGQLLEYAYYPGRPRPKHVSVVLDAEPSHDEIEWIRTLNTVLPPIELFWLVGTGVRTAGLTSNPITVLAQ